VIRRSRRDWAAIFPVSAALLAVLGVILLVAGAGGYGRNAKVPILGNIGTGMIVLSFVAWLCTAVISRRRRSSPSARQRPSPGA